MEVRSGREKPCFVIPGQRFDLGLEVLQFVNQETENVGACPHGTLPANSGGSAGHSFDAAVSQPSAPKGSQLTMRYNWPWPGKLQLKVMVSPSNAAVRMGAVRNL